MDGDFRVGPWLVQASLNAITHDGVTIHLEPKVMQVLVCLAQHPGELLSKEKLLQTVWPDTFVSEDVLKRSISELRRVFEDDAREPRIIQTIPKRGYRLIAHVDPFTPEPSRSSSKDPVDQRPTATRRFRTQNFTSLQAVLAVALAIALVSIGILWFALQPSKSVPFVEEVPLIGQTGLEVNPAFSPDGNQVAFARHGETSGIFIALVGGDKLLQLTRNDNDCCPTWSPDGRHLAFFRNSGGKLAIYVIPALGGAERRFYLSTHGRYPFDESFDESMTWSADGKLLAFSEWNAEEDRRQITLLSLADLRTRPLSAPQVGCIDRAPAFSPNAKSLAFVRSIGSALGPAGDLFVVPLSGDEPKRLTFDNRWIVGPPTWTSDSRDIVFSSNRGGLSTLWRISASGGAPAPVPGVGPIALQPSVSLHGHRLAYVHRVANQNIWLLKLRDQTHALGPPSILATSKGSSALPQFSPDGNRIAFESERSGYDEVWISSSDGSDPTPVTSLRGYAGSPHWSPDGRYLAFDFSDRGHTNIYVVEVPGGLPRLLETFPGADNIVPAWSRDGEWIYFSANREGEAFQLWKVPARGGAPVQITKQGGIAAAESGDGFLYYSRGLALPAVWKMPIDGGKETLVLDRPTPQEYTQWAPARNGIYFIDFRTNSGWTIEFFDFRTRKIVPVWTLQKSPWAGLAVSPDGKSVIFAQNDQDEYSITLVDNFH